MVPPLQLGLGMGLPLSGVVPNPYLLNQNFLDPTQYRSGGWLFNYHSRSSAATVVDENGLITYAPENAPRLQHDANGNPLGYLHEPQVTNLLADPLNLTPWNRSNFTQSPDSYDDVMGGTTGKLITPTASTNYFYQNAPVEVNSKYTIEMWFRVPAGKTAIVALSGGAAAFPDDGRTAGFDLTNGTLFGSHENATSTIKYFSQLNAYRCRVTITANTTLTSCPIAFGMRSENATAFNDNTTPLTGTEQVIFMGANATKSASGSSFIPTGNGVRQADTVTGFPIADGKDITVLTVLYNLNRLVGGQYVWRSNDHTSGIRVNGTDRNGVNLFVDGTSSSFCDSNSVNPDDKIGFGARISSSTDNRVIGDVAGNSSPSVIDLTKAPDLDFTDCALGTEADRNFIYESFRVFGRGLNNQSLQKEFLKLLNT